MDATALSEKAPVLRDLPSRLLAQTAALAGRIVAEVLEGEGAHRHQFAVLATLQAFGASSQAELCRRTDLDRSDMNAVVTALEATGSVERKVDPDNRRRNIVTLTARGRRRFAQLRERLEQAQDRVLAPLDRGERRELVRLLQVLHDHLTPTGVPDAG
jgi:DNA-binding MarR family transcriptional regulator